MRFTKSIFLDFNQEGVCQALQKHFESLIKNGDFLSQIFPFIHFNYYSRGDGQMYDPAEFAVSQWSISKGLEAIRGGPIDPGEVTDVSQMWERSERLYLPRVPYTYKPTVAYSVGEDRYGLILDYINQHAMTLKISKLKYVFTAKENLEVVAGCISWLSSKTGKKEIEMNLRVFPVESFVAELIRACIFKKDFDSEDTKTNTEALSPSSNGIRINSNCELIKEPKREVNADDAETKFELKEEPESEGKPDVDTTDGQSCSNTDRVKTDQSVEYVSESYIKNKIVTNSFWNSRIKLGCHWHKTQQSCGGILSCSTMFVKKWTYLTICEVSKILQQNFRDLVLEMECQDIRPILWNISSAISIEARQRFGHFGEISLQRRQILENDFVFPDFLLKLQEKLPNGLVTKPKEIIWPLERSIQEDLNYSANASFLIADLNREDRDKRTDIKRRKIDPENVKNADW